MGHSIRNPRSAIRNLALLALIVGLAASTSRAEDTYPVEIWPADATVQNLGGTDDDQTGLPYIARGTGPSSSPPLQIQYHRREYRQNLILGMANQLRVAKEGTLSIGAYPGDYVINGTRTHFAGATDQAVSSSTDTYYVYIDNANALQIDTDWPVDESQFVPLAEVVVADGSITSITDRRGYAWAVIPQTGGSAIDGTDEVYFILDQDNGGAGASSEYRFNRGSTDDDAALKWNETADLFEFFSDRVAADYGGLRGLAFESTVTTGTAPFVVASTTVCTNLNADSTDGVSIAGGGAMAPGGVTYASGVSALSVTAAGTSGQVLRSGGASAPTWTTIGATGGALEAWDSDLDAVAGLASTGLIARTAAGTASVRTITGGANVTVTNGDGVSGNPTLAVSGATQYAVQVGSAAGALTSVSVGPTNTVLCGNTGANPGFRQIVNADISDSAGITFGKTSIPSGSDIEWISGKLLLTGGGVGDVIPGTMSFSLGSESSDKRTVHVYCQPWNFESSVYVNPGVCDVWLSDDTTGAITGTACTSMTASSGLLLYTYTTGKMWKFLMTHIGFGYHFEIEYTGGAKTWYLFITQGGGRIWYATLVFAA